MGLTLIKLSNSIIKHFQVDLSGHRDKGMTKKPVEKKSGEVL